jgi:alpha-ribazole phosphatase
MDLYIVRHGLTNYNFLKLCTHIPTANVYLIEEGIKKAQTVHEELKNIDFDKVYVSDLYRTWQTAKIIVPNKKFTIDTRITDVNTGCEGEPYDTYMNAIKHDRFNARFRDGESFQDVKKRVYSFIDDICGERILIVFHHNPIVAMRTFFHKLSDEDAYYQGVPNCQVFKIEYNK